MKRIALLWCVLVTVAWVLPEPVPAFGQASIRFLEQPEWDAVVKQAQREHKIIFFDAYTTWCGPCKRMEVEVFTRPEEAAFFNQNFINVRYDMERGEGRELRKRFGVKVFPTYQFISADGQVLHRIVGAHTAPGVFLHSSRKALTYNGYLAALEYRFAHGERNARFMLEYLEALQMAGEREREQELAAGFLALMSADHFLDNDYWNILEKYLADPSSRLFRELLTNQQQIAGKHEPGTVMDKILNVFDNALVNIRSNADSDTAQVAQMIALLREHASLPRRNELLARSLCLRYQHQANWWRYAATVQAMIEFHFLDEHPYPLRQLDAHARILAAQSDERLWGIALDWVDYCCRRETQPEELAWFLQTKSALLALTGQSEAAAESRMHAERNKAAAERNNRYRKDWPNPNVKQGEAVGAKY